MSSLVGMGSALGRFFDWDGTIRPPSHHEIAEAVRRHDLAEGDPWEGPSSKIGKMKRVQAVLSYASVRAPAAGTDLALELVSLARVHGKFVPANEDFAGEDRIEALRRALQELGYTLDSSGGVHPAAIDNLEGTELTSALERLVNRVNQNPDDHALMIGTGKELFEAAARHVLVETQGSYDDRGPASHVEPTLFNAFGQTGLTAAAQQARGQLSSDPAEQVDQCLFLLALAVNKFRNEVGTGHGRPHIPTIESARARAAARASAVVAGTLLDGLHAVQHQRSRSRERT